nr:iron-sulfur cluster-binding protein [uncultured bacterium]
MTRISPDSIPVFLAKRDTYERNAIAALVEEMAGSLGFAASWAGRTVLLKPNLISASAPSLACTDAEFIAGVCRWFLDHGARVRIGDSPAFGSAARAMRQHGIDRALAGMAVEKIEFVTPVEKRLACGCTVQVAAESIECDLLVNLPKVKAHNQMYVTLAVKNVFGVVLGMRKAMLHMREGGVDGRFTEIILDLLEILPRQLAIADGIVAMHRDGPIGGEALGTGCVAGSTSCVALDTALLAALELDPASSPLWREAARRGLPGSRATDIIYPLLTPEVFAGSGFSAPVELNGIRFNPIRFLRGMLRRFVLALRPQV